MNACSWTYKNEPVLEISQSILGFIYIITNLIDGRQYIGKKKAFFSKTSVKTVLLKNGKKKKKKIKTQVPSDWPEYYGSSTELQKDVETLGRHNFKREIVRFCSSLSELTYYEAKLQFETDCLLHPDKYYNAWAMCRVRRDHLIKFAQNAE